MHQQSRLFIETPLKADPVKTAVVTHHLPHAKSIPSRFRGDLLNAASASDLSDMIECGRSALWVHGRTHDRAQRVVETARERGLLVIKCGVQRNTVRFLAPRRHA
jgi:hypothetical protein